MPSKKDKVPDIGVTRRMFLQAGARVTTLAAICATFGATIVSACMSSDDSGGGNGSGSGGKGDGYGYGYCGYGGGYGYGYGYGYNCP